MHQHQHHVWNVLAEARWAGSGGTLAAFAPNTGPLVTMQREKGMFHGMVSYVTQVTSGGGGSEHPLSNTV